MKHVFKTTPVSLFDIQSLEGWLEEQANEGLFPLWVNGDFTQFRRDDAAPGTRFRLEAADGKEAPEPEQLELYKEAGWEYGDMVGKAYFLFYTTDPSATELHTDPVTRGLSLEQLAGEVQKARRKQRIWRYVILGILIAGGAVIWRVDSRQLPLYFLDMSGSLLILLPLFLCFWRNDEREYRCLLDLQRSLELGITPKPHRPRRRNFWFVPFWIAIPLFGLIIVLWTGRLFGFWDYPTAKPLEDFSGTYVNLQQLESEPLLTYEDLFGEPHHKSPGSDWGESTVTRKFALLSPGYYTVNQTLLSPEDWESKSGYSSSGEPEYVYSPTLEAVYFHLLIPAMARPVALAQMAEQEAVNLTWTYEEIDYPGLDFVILSRSNSQYQGVAVAKGGRLAVFHYGGREDLADHLDALAKAVNP
ncbi:DUF2812 domain-containing protein [Colidextribacter sp. OB.20]|uniref:DUF2812 domain-containing protein n=1 Tax=Colidextribacter sp. OB.20 TaxID=2304568 RepID=UPI00136ABF3F|nr:DUF2812 domain-containing protein [Colidextribacter sp. OB.20]NBI09456.1 DUF2812 domain-containing protein [Colidextribacter sp. OB.20]